MRSRPRTAPRLLHVHVLAALGVISLPGAAISAPVPDATTLAALNGTCPVAAPGSPGANLLSGRTVTFEPNAGQAPDALQFLARNAARGLALRSTGPVIETRAPGALLPRRPEARREEADTSRVWLTLVDGNPGAPARPECETPTRSNYFLGSDPQRWQRNLPNYGRVRYEGVRPGVDLVYYGRGTSVEYDLIAHPGSDPRSLAFTIDGGASAAIDPAGDLVISTPAGEVRHQRPVAYQANAGGVELVPAAYALVHDAESQTWSVGFELGEFDAQRDLVIDPVLAYSTFVGASGHDFESGGFIGVDASGHVYVAGSASSSVFGPPNSFNAEVFKIDTVANTVLYSTTFGGSGSDFVNAAVVDAAGNVYAGGSTTSGNFPRCFGVTDCATLSGVQDGFVARLDSGGNLNYSHLLGGSGNDQVLAVAVDASGRIYAGGRGSSTFPLVNPVNPSYLGGSGDAFVARIVPSGAGLDFSTFIGSSGDDVTNGVAVDSAGNIFAVGMVRANDMATSNAFQGTFGGGFADGFLVKIDPAGPSIPFQTYIGGSASDIAYAVAIEPITGDVYVTGQAQSEFYGFSGVASNSHAGGLDAFLMRANANSGALSFATYLGSSGSDVGRALAPDRVGGMYVAGQGQGANFPRVGQIAGAWTGNPAFDSSAFVAHYTPGNTLNFSTYLGGSATDDARSVVVAADRSVWVSGVTSSPLFPMRNAQRDNMFGTSDFFASRIAFAPKRDLDGNGQTDITWKDPSGQAAVWTMNGLTPATSALLIGPSTGWSIVNNEGDFNGDGSADILWANDDGTHAIWLMNGIVPVGSAVILGPAGGWTTTKVADLNGDGYSDIVWKHLDGRVAGWLMNGTTAIGSSVLLGPSTGWQVTHTGDLNGDGRADLIWRHVDGSVAAWLMNGIAPIASGIVFGPTPEWTVTHAGDLDGDGRADLVWRNATGGQVSVWTMNGLAPATTGIVYGGGSYTVTHVADLDGDGRVDLIFRDTTSGAVSAWLMNGLTVASSGVLFGGGGGWTVTHTGDYDGDGRADLLWRDSGGQVAIWQMNGLAPVTTGLIFGGSGGWQPSP